MWYLWHGHVVRALQVVDDLEPDLEAEDPSPEQQKFVKALAELGNYVRANASWVPNYGERYRAGEAISSSLAESAVNQVVSKRMVKRQLSARSEQCASAAPWRAARTCSAQPGRPGRSWTSCTVA